MISMIILKAKFFPVINGKKSSVETMNGIKGMANMPTSTIFRNILLNCIPLEIGNALRVSVKLTS